MKTIPLKHLGYVLLFSIIVLVTACSYQPSSDQIQADQQEKITAEGTAAVGMPAIKNFRERRMLKLILELRDQEGLVTYTYIQDNQTNKLRYFGQTVGYGIPYATQYTSPEKSEWVGGGGGGRYVTLPQSDPNGLFSPADAEGTWVLMADPTNPSNVQPVYIEPRIVVSPFKLTGPNIEQ